MVSCPLRLREPELLENALHEERPDRGRVGVDLGEAAALGGRDELAPGDALEVGAAREAAPVPRLGADPHRVEVSRRREVDAETVVRDVDVGPDLLRPVSRHPASDREDAELLRPEGELREAVEVEVEPRIGRTRSSAASVASGWRRPAPPAVLRMSRAGVLLRVRSVARRFARIDRGGSGAGARDPGCGAASRLGPVRRPRRVHVGLPEGRYRDVRGHA